MSVARRALMPNSRHIGSAARGAHTCIFMGSAARPKCRISRAQAWTPTITAAGLPSTYVSSDAGHMVHLLPVPLRRRERIADRQAVHGRRQGTLLVQAAGLLHKPRLLTGRAHDDLCDAPAHTAPRHRPQLMDMHRFQRTVFALMPRASMR